MLLVSILAISVVSACISFPMIEKNKNCNFSVEFFSQNETQILESLNSHKINCSFSNSDIQQLKDYVKLGYSVKFQTTKEYQKFLADAKKENEKTGCVNYYKAVARKGLWTIYIYDLKTRDESGKECPQLKANCPAAIVAAIVWNDLIETPIVGNDSDEHGCKGSAGYSWCEEKNKCLRIWEENCTQKTKILPETASLRARERLGELGFNISLKEVGQNKTVYIAEAEKQGKFLGLFKVKAKVSAEIDSETGEVIKTHKPWWSFLAGI